MPQIEAEDEVPVRPLVVRPSNVKVVRAEDIPEEFLEAIRNAVYGEGPQDD